jgi:endonuclease/exonuclease/phosphatase family metal-dependent hydrolase
MKKIFGLVVFIYVTNLLHAQISICSWNLENFGKSKTNNTIELIAGILKDYDVIAVQEVVAEDIGGAQAIAKLNDALNRKGSKWNYVISDPTSGENSYKRERYAFLWNASKVSLIGKPWLEIKYATEINREPFFATFKSKGKLFTLVNFHAITKSKQPETEIKYFKFLPAEYPGKNLIFCGDFNCPQSHTVFNPLKSMGYKPTLTKQKTSLKEECNNTDCLASEFDNMFYNTSQTSFIKSGVILFYKNFSTLKDARVISDHIPIWFQFSLN